MFSYVKNNLLKLSCILYRVRELEKEKRELEQQMMTERKTLNCLREDLVAEKVSLQWS